MSAKLKELRDERGRLIAEARGMLDAAEAAKRNLNDEEQAKYNGLISKQDELRARIEREERQAELDRESAQRSLENKEIRKGSETAEKGAGGVRAMPEYRDAFGRFLRGDQSAAAELRALSADQDTQGGFTVLPVEMVNQLIKFVDNLVFVRSMANVIRLNAAQALGVPSLDADPADADWTSELQTGNEDSSMLFGKRELHPKPLAKLIKVSRKLLNVSVLDIESLVLQRLGYKFAVSQEKAFLTGSGAGQPLGVFTASNDGIPTSRDFSTGNSTTAIAFDGLIEAKYALKAQYWGKATWMFHRDAMKMVSKLKDGEGQYLWRASVQSGEPDTILGRPVNMSEYVPNTFTTGLYVGIIGDFSQYWIADALDMQIQRLNELYAATNQIGFIGRWETDGAPVLAEAFARVKLA